MLQITSRHKIFIGIQPIDFRKGIDGIVAVCHRQLQLDPFSGHFFIFRNRRATAIKVLAYDAHGFWLCHKRLSSGTFKNWPTAQQAMLTLSAAQLLALIYNGDPLDVEH